MFASYSDHFKELRKRVIFCIAYFIVFFVIGYIFRDYLIKVLFSSLKSNSKFADNNTIITTNIFEIFSSSVKVSALFSFFLSIPILLYNTYQFCSPALQIIWKKRILLIFVASYLLLILSVFILHFLLLPKAIEFFNNFIINSVKIHQYISFNTYICFLIKCYFTFGLVFQLPLLIIISVLSGMLELSTLLSNRKIPVLVSFLIAGFIAPPDIMSHIFVAILILVIYFCTLLIIKRILLKNNG